MAKTIHIYTDASSKDTTMFPQGVKRTVKVGVIVINSNIVSRENGFVPQAFVCADIKNKKIEYFY